MIVGEAPGLEEEKTNKTFQGESGVLLEKMLLAINIISPATWNQLWFEAKATKASILFSLD